MPSFSIALTGLQADSVALNTIGNNLANLNTTAYKKQDAKFADLFYQTIGTSGSSTPLQVGIGTRISSIDTNFSNGTINSDTNPAHMAINGDGFFVIKRQGAPELTRDGNFQMDPHGNLITADGFSVMGFPVSNGSLATTAPLQPLHIPIGTTQPAQASRNFSFTASLDATAPVGTQVNAPTTMYDSLGQSHSMTLTFTKTADSTWNYSAALPGGDAASSTGTTGTLTFQPDGTLAPSAGSSVAMTFNGLSNHASDLTLNWQLRDSNGGSLITQTAAASSINANSQDGFQSGVFQSFSIDSAGIVNGLYSSGHVEVLGQIAVATVANPAGLSRQGGNTYLPDESSGGMNIGIAGSGSRGTIEGSALELSNVDISTEFSNLIVAQRSFQANSKTITAFDSVTQDTINMIR